MRWTAFFLATTVLTSVTGFGFPIKGMTPGIAFGIISLVVLAAVIYARYPRHLAGLWRRVYVIGAVFAFYLNFVVLIVQSFQKVPAAPRSGPESERAALPGRAGRLDGRVPRPRHARGEELPGVAARGNSTAILDNGRSSMNPRETSS